MMSKFKIILCASLCAFVLVVQRCRVVVVAREVMRRQAGVPHKLLEGVETLKTVNVFVEAIAVHCSSNARRRTIISLEAETHTWQGELTLIR